MPRATGPAAYHAGRSRAFQVASDAYGQLVTSLTSPARSGYDGSFYRFALGPKYYFTPNLYGRAAFIADVYDGKVLNAGGLRPFDDGLRNHQQVMSFDLVWTY